MRRVNNGYGINLGCLLLRFLKPVHLLYTHFKKRSFFGLLQSVNIVQFGRVVGLSTGL